ncbi:hypothetical protein D9619_011560 [Psilocybe cf. subviscida]|uniref:Uncharacterized protein n=1 Tax=Psilocybe cf. subviscida TaxID=2480587 RepID=A0A8H5F9M0_9AGAR|nr:hypothetical protein D9619_011560 [Psilocybe cf. subviscida]
MLPAPCPHPRFWWCRCPKKPSQRVYLGGSKPGALEAGWCNEDGFRSRIQIPPDASNANRSTLAGSGKTSGEVDELGHQTLQLEGEGGVAAATIR